MGGHNEQTVAEKGANVNGKDLTLRWSTSLLEEGRAF